MLYYKPVKLTDAEHTIVYRKNDEFCSWPFNAGMWKLSDQHVLVGFMNIACNYSVPGQLNHDRVETYGRIAAARTLDGGRTWSEAADIEDNYHLAEPLLYGPARKIAEGADFSDPNVLLACWSTPNSGSDKAKAWIKLSRDGGAAWGEAVLLPGCGIPRYQGRPSYIVRPDGVILLFLTAKPKTNPHDRPVVFASFDSGVNWSLISLMPASHEYRMICPSPVLLPSGTILAAVRCKPDMIAAWNELYASEDGGRTWRFVSRINDHGDVVDLKLLSDGRLLAVYGYRRPPFGIRAACSEDGGRTWGPELILRDDGGSKDLGYPRVVETTPGEALAAYYFNEANDPNGYEGGIRHIAATRFKP